MMETDMSCGDCRPMLEALIDEELGPEDAERVRAHVATCVECARTLESQKDLSRLLRDNLVHYEAPDVLKARIRSALSQTAESSETGGGGTRTPALRGRWIRLAAAGLAIAAASSGTTFLAMRTAASERSVAGEVLTSHVRSLMPGHVVDVASNDQHNVKPWFNGRLALSPPVPRLDSLNFRLIGGRLDYLSGHPAAVVVYARRQHLINVYAWPQPGADTREASRSTQGYNLVNWRSGDVEFWVVSDLNARELAEFTGLYRGVGR
jgi:mycothiol system anti-sigma-R factor